MVHAKARDYPIFVAPDGRKFPSMVKAWHFHTSNFPLSLETLPSGTLSLQTGPTVPILAASNALTDDATTPNSHITDVLLALLRACDLTVHDVPPGVLTSASAAFSKDCPAVLRDLARERVALFGCESVPRTRQPSPTRPVSVLPSQGVSYDRSPARDRRAAAYYTQVLRKADARFFRPLLLSGHCGHAMAGAVTEVSRCGRPRRPRLGS